MPPLKAVIFDVDGTLVDSERDGHRVAFNLAFEEAGLPDRWDVELYGDLLAVAGGRKRLAHWFERTERDDPEGLATKLHKRKTEILRDLIAEGRIGARPGMHALIDDLEQHNVAMHVATTGTRAWVEPLLRRTFGDRFDLVITGDDVSRLKPDPEAYLKVLDGIRVEAESVVAIEDSANGLRAAVAAGLTCLVARNPYTANDDFSGAAIVTDGPDDPVLLSWLHDRLA